MVKNIKNSSSITIIIYFRFSVHWADMDGIYFEVIDSAKVKIMKKKRIKKLRRINNKKNQDFRTLCKDFNVVLTSHIPNYKIYKYIHIILVYLFLDFHS